MVLPEKARGRVGLEREEYPVLYLLHGMSDNQSAWMRRTNIERYAMDHKIAVVMPSTHLGWYTDMARGFRYFTYIADEIPQTVHRMFSCLKQGREHSFVGGLSMGGYGAAMLALRRSDRFSKAILLSGAYDIYKRLHQAPKQRKKYFETIFGKEVNASTQDPFFLAEVLEERLRPEIWMYCGRDDGLLEENRRFYETLQRLDYSVSYEEDAGKHDWDFWDAKIKSAMQHLGGKR